MLIVALNWLYVIFTTYAIGYGLHHTMTGISFLQKAALQKRNAALRTRPYEIHFRENYLITGLVAAAIYAQIWSIFGGVALAANIVLFGVSLFISGYAFYSLLKKLKAAEWEPHFHISAIALYLFLFLFMAYFTSHGIEHYDTGLYHAQAIHWNETYGAVTGLGNFNQRLAYNSSVYPLSALYSFSFFGGQSLHALAGYFALLLAWKCADLRHIRKRGYPTLADAVRLLAIYYLFTILDEMVSPASDYFAMTLVLYILISWLELDRNHEKGFYPYAMLSVLSVYAVTVKLSTAPLLLLSIKPIWKIARSHHVARRSAVLFFLFLGFLTAVPFLIRNFIISGWLVYPFTAIDLFHVPWKIAKGTAEYDAHEIAVYGRGYTDAAQYDIPVSKWFPNWWNAANLGHINQIMCILDAVCLIGLLLFVIIYFLILHGPGKNRNRKHHILSGLQTYEEEEAEAVLQEHGQQGESILETDDTNTGEEAGEGTGPLKFPKVQTIAELKKQKEIMDRRKEEKKRALLAEQNEKKASCTVPVHAADTEEKKKNKTETSSKEMRRTKLYAARKVVLLARHRTVSARDFVFVEAIAYTALFFWFFSSPLVRYGTVYIWLPAVLMIGKIVTMLFYVRGFGRNLQKALIAAIVLFLGYKMVNLGMYEIPRYQSAYLWTQQDYAVYDLTGYEIDGVTLYYPVSGDQTGYAPFPSAPTKAQVTLRGDSLKDGFLHEK